MIIRNKVFKRIPVLHPNLNMNHKVVSICIIKLYQYVYDVVVHMVYEYFPPELSTPTYSKNIHRIYCSSMTSVFVRSINTYIYICERVCIYIYKRACM